MTSSTTLLALLLAHACLSAAAGDVSDFVKPCSDDYSDFDVSLRDSSGNLFGAKCIHSYARCPFDDDVGPDGKCLGNAYDWTSEGGRSLDFLETRVFDLSGDWPEAVVVSDNKQRYGCGRALYKDNYADFRFDDELEVGDWWNGRDGDSDPVQITIVPFDCDQPELFDVERSLSIWLSGYRGQDSDPNDGGIYCDLSINPRDCLNFAYWDVAGDELVYYGTLTDALSHSPAELNIYVPEGYDVNMPINNVQLRFKIASGYEQGCVDWADGDQGSECRVDSVYETSEPPHTKIYVSGLGRINGWDALTTQRSNGYYFNCGKGGQDQYCFDYLDQRTDIRNEWAGFAEWYVSSMLLGLSSAPTGADYAVDVSGVTVGWGSKHGFGTIRLNAVAEDTFDYSVKMFDLKYAGGWNDQADAIDTYASGSWVGFTYLQCNDDSIKVSSTNSQQYQSTVLQGRAGCAVNIGAYGYNNVDGSVTSGVYVHRIFHASGDGWNGCGDGVRPGGDGRGGLICTRSCGENSNGIADYALETMYVPELGAGDDAANSISRLFAIGVNGGGGFCDGVEAVVDPYPIANVVFKDVNVYPTPGCMSLMMDDSGRVRWGSPSVRFYDKGSSDPSKCDFEGAVAFSMDPSYFVCGFADDNDAASYCMSNQGVGSAPNVEYEISNGDNPNIDFPVCGQALAIV